MDADRQVASLAGLLAPSERLVTFLKAWEGPPHLAPREDPCVPGVWDRGYGCVCLRDAEPLASIDEAVDLLRDKVNAFAMRVRAHVSMQLAQHQFDALVSFSFNEGEKAFAGSTLLRVTEFGHFADAAAQ